jgi:threonylcarbamoyladenosine tRNA methylthiotransferase MtaB
MSDVEIITFGCRLNAYESEVMREHATAAGLTSAVIVNTCAVTAEAVRQARQAIRKARRMHPGAKLVVTGCAAQIDPEAFARMAEVDHVIGNQEKTECRTFEGLAHADTEKVVVNDIMSVTETASHLIDGFGNRARAYVQIQNGCDHRCTFCIIPFGRGNSRSVPIGAVVNEARRLVEKGFAEIVLTGVDLTSYGGDLPGTPSLGLLVEKLLAKQGSAYNTALSGIEFDSDMTVGEAQEAISEDGYWGVNAVSDRIVAFAKAVSGDDPGKLAELKAAIDEGFKRAGDIFDGELPGICGETYNAIMDKLDDWAAESKNG